jgi:2-C-methyl-D-erythritol 4-phosphate cytidylyltransferase
LREVYELIDTNYKGMINVTLNAVKYLKESRGQILHFTSSSYTRGRAMYAMYSSAKSAIVNFVQAVSEEWKEYGIRINCINPERTKTPMREKNFGIEDEKSLLQPEYVAKISLITLLNDCTGEIIDIKI